ncbi:hypothetical protein F7725_023425 [Dissostichus mawsoni]|uniref:Uncharacterized protein n=1 Tax=Dissostichus mawsoni TaxID=36200 RepID=A0A7J5Z119_DISMA|nr:hypothetical protein F7725_023425 [Dissostichus mawsoni]
MQISRNDDDEALCRRPPGDVVEDGLQEVVVFPFPHAGEVGQVEASTLVCKVPETLLSCSSNFHSKVIFVGSSENPTSDSWSDGSDFLLQTL